MSSLHQPPAITSQLASLDATLTSIDAELKQLQTELKDLIQTSTTLEKRIDSSIENGADDAITSSLQKRLTRLEAREDSMREKERDLRVKERMVREERMAVLNVWREVAVASGNTSASDAVSEGGMPLQSSGGDSRPESAAGVAFEWLATSRTPDLSMETIPTRMLTPPLSPDPVSASVAGSLPVFCPVPDNPSPVIAAAAEEIDVVDKVDDGAVELGSSGEAYALPESFPINGNGVVELEEIKPSVAELHVAESIQESVSMEVVPALEPYTEERLPSPVTMETPPAIIPEETLPEPVLTETTPLKMGELSPTQKPADSSPGPEGKQDEENGLPDQFDTRESSSHTGSIEDDPDTEGYTAPALGLRTMRHGSMVRGIPMERSFPSLTASPSSRSTARIQEHPETSNVSTENTEDLLMDETTPVRSSLGRLIQQFVSSPIATTPKSSRGRESPTAAMSTTPKPSLSRQSSLGKLLNSQTPRQTKPRSSSSAIPIPLQHLGRSPSATSSVASSLPSFSPDLILTEDEGEEIFFNRGPMPAPLVERRRESLKVGGEDWRWKVFIGYCWEDVHMPCDPRKIAQHLNDAGLSTWLDIERLDSRKAVFPQLVDGILRADVIVVCVSKSWSRSPICNKEFRLICQLKVPVLIVQIGETRPGVWRRIGRVTLDSPGIVDATKPKNIKASLDLILSETRWLVSRTLSTNGSLLHPPQTPASPALSKLGRTHSSSSTHSSASSHATAISPSPSPSPSSSGVPLSRTPSSMKRFSSHGEFGQSSIGGGGGHYFQAHTPSPLSPMAQVGGGGDPPGLTVVKRLAGSGDPMAQFRLGVLSDAGIGIPPSSPSSHQQQHSPAATVAFRWFSAAADKGHREAMYRLANLFERGRGVQKDLEKAKKLYEASFAMGSPDAGCSLAGVMREMSRSQSKTSRLTESRRPLSDEAPSKPAHIPHERWTDEMVTILERSASLGSIRAMFRLGIAMYDRKDYTASSAWFSRAAEEADDGGAMFNLGTMAERGRGVRKSLADAAKWYGLAADHRYDVAAAVGASSTSAEHAMASVHALFNLGVFYEHGWGVEKDLKKCIAMYREAATYGHVKAQFNYGVCLKKGRGTARNLEEAVRWYFKAADQGHADAQFNLGNSYKYGEGVEKDIKEAARWYQKASIQGHSKAQFNLALCYDEGEGIEKDATEAARLYKLSAEAGNAISQFYYGTALEQGRGIDRNINEAARMYRLAADQGDPDAASSLAHCYLTGDGVPRSPKDSMKWFRVASEAGEPEAQYMLGMLLRKTDKNAAESLLWLRRSARQGHAEALFEVGCAHEMGWGVPIEFDKAARWFARAAKAGHPKAAQRIIVGRGS
ncbi:hypothetical protein HDU67_004724 [Dinochytrium kinnereticum]|nr:hypothetical protein HDU67_004724 [Dinochytrium kinnereticum]